MATLPPTYGSDQTGLVCGYLFLPGLAPQAVTATQTGAWLEGESQADGAFVWLHFNLANTASEKWLHEHTALADEFYESLHEGQRSTLIELADNALIAIINDVVHDFSFDPSDISTLWLSVDRRAVISARRQQLKAVDSLRLAVQAGEALRSPAPPAGAGTGRPVPPVAKAPPPGSPTSIRKSCAKPAKNSQWC